MGTNDIKKIIKDRRIELGLTMLDVSKAVGVSEATVSRWESGSIENMKLDKVEQLAKVLRLSPSELMGWDDNELFFDRYFINDQRNKTHIHISTYKCLKKNIDNLTNDIKNILQIIVLDSKGISIDEITESVIYSLTFEIFDGILSEIFNKLKINIYGTISNNFTTVENYKQYYFDLDVVKSQIEEFSLYIDNTLISLIKNCLRNEIISKLKSFYLPLVLEEEYTVKNLIEETLINKNILNLIVYDLSNYIKQELVETIRLEIIYDIYYTLNETGQQKISEYVEDLGENEKYRKELQ